LLADRRRQGQTGYGMIMRDKRRDRDRAIDSTNT
jgi:hypothetical protein